MVHVTREAKVGRPARITEDVKDAMVIAYNGGARTADIAKQYQVSVQTVRKILRQRRAVSDGRK